jgi:hypothetical protein
VNKSLNELFMKSESHGNNGRKGNDESSVAHDSHSSQKKHQPVQRPIIPPRGDYQTLLSYQKAEVIYDITFRFTQKFLSKGDRTVDQMIQSARSGKQNILEASKAATTSKETEIKLTNVGRASQEELLADYRDYLRVRDHQLWGKDSREARYVRDLGRRSPQTFELYREFVETRPADSPDQLFAGPAIEDAGERIHRTRRPARADDQSSAEPSRSEAEGVNAIGGMRLMGIMPHPIPSIPPSPATIHKRKQPRNSRLFVWHCHSAIKANGR